jgi:ABC-type transport system involved in multi-copper enzyme maturation permease subunit
MSRLIRIELAKLKTTRLTYGLLALAAGLTALDALLRDSRAGNGRLPALSLANGLRNGLTVTGFSLLMAGVLGVTVSSGEFRHQTATVTYLEAPNRNRVLAAKMVASSFVGLMFGGAGAAFATGVTMAFVAGNGDHVALSATTILGYVGGAVVAGALMAATGAAVGSLVRGQIGAVIGVLVWAFFIESVVGGLFNSIAPYLPFTAATTLAGSRLGGGGFGFGGSSSAVPLPFGTAALLVVGVAAVIAVVAARTTVAADIT